MSAIWRVRSTPSGRPSQAIVPASGRRSPARHSRVVVLPAPFGPSSARISPGRTAIESRSTAVTWSKLLIRPSTVRPPVWPDGWRTTSNSGRGWGVAGAAGAGGSDAPRCAIGFHATGRRRARQVTKSRPGRAEPPSCSPGPGFVLLYRPRSPSGSCYEHYGSSKHNSAGSRRSTARRDRDGEASPTRPVGGQLAHLGRGPLVGELGALCGREQLVLLPRPRCHPVL